jgi:hypothetical protein
MVAHVYKNPALGRLKKEDHKLKASLGYIKWGGGHERGVWMMAEWAAYFSRDSTHLDIQKVMF